MDIWLPLRHEGQGQVLRILTRVANLPLPKYTGTNPPPLDELLEKLVEDKWAGVPGRPVGSLTADRLLPLAEVTTQLNGLLFTESDRRKIIAVVDRVIPFLERQRNGRSEGPGEDVRGVVIALLEILRAPIQSASHPTATLMDRSHPRSPQSNVSVRAGSFSSFTTYRMSLSVQHLWELPIGVSECSPLEFRSLLKQAISFEA